jgi:hypothetical protein
VNVASRGLAAALAVEPLPRAKHVVRGRLALPLCDNPVLYADLLAGQPVGPSRDVTRGPNTGNARLQIGVDGNAAIDSDARLFGE